MSEPLDKPFDERVEHSTIEIPADALVLLVGASGSGKSSLARRLFPAEAILSSDAIRGRLTGDEANQAASPRTFQVLHDQTGRRLAGGRLTVVDATNVNASARRPLHRLALAHGRPIVVLVLDLPPDVCYEHNAARPGRVVPGPVVGRQLSALRRTLERRELASEPHDALVVLASIEALDRLSVRLTAAVRSDTLSATGHVPANQVDRSRSRTP